MSATGLTRQIATWVEATTFDDLPRRVVEEAKNQTLSVVAAMHAGHFSELGRAVRRTVKDWNPGKDATIVPSGERMPLQAALLVNGMLSAALEYDDYLFSAQPGHSAVVAGLALAESEGLSGKDLVVCQVLANELIARIGVLLAPHGLPAPALPVVHRIGGAVVASKALKLDVDCIVAALGLTLACPGDALTAGQLGGDGRAFATAEATQFGVQAAQLAAHGVRSGEDALGEPQGLLCDASNMPVAEVFATLGSTWLTETLSYKVYPVHAGSAAIIDCVLDIVRQHAIDPKKVAAVRIVAAPLAVEAFERAQPFIDGVNTAVSALAYAIPYNVAVAILDRELTARQLTRERISEPSVWALAARVHVSRDENFAERARNAWLARPHGSAGRMTIDLDPLHVTQFRMSAGARVRIELEDGRSFEAEEEVSIGAAGRAYDDRRKAVEDKFRRETRYSLRKEKMEKAIDLILHMERASAANVREIVRLCCSERD